MVRLVNLINLSIMETSLHQGAFCKTNSIPHTYNHIFLFHKKYLVKRVDHQKTFFATGIHFVRRTNIWDIIACS